MNVLVVKLGSIGDIAHTLPVLAAIKSHYPDARIDWLVETRFRDLLSQQPLIERLVEVDTLGWRRAVLRPATWLSVLQNLRTLRASHYDVVFDFQGLVKSSLLARLARATRRVGFGKASREPVARHFLSESEVPPESIRHVVSRNLYLLRALGIDSPSVEFPIEISSTTQADVEQDLDAMGVSRYFLLNPGAGWETKCWAPDRFGELAAIFSRETALAPLVLWGPGEKSRAEEVVRASGETARLAPATDLKRLLPLLRGAQFVVGGDTGPIHLASALGTPVVGLYGPSNPESHGPFGDKVQVVWKRVECSPCHKRTCPGFDMQCLTTMSVADVATAVNALVAQ